jgi:drug/metabolite transporter (DMT)-like permease
MPAPLLIAAASLLFSLMSLAVKTAAGQYGIGEIVFYRSAVGVLLMAVLLRRRRLSIATPVPAMHFWRSASGVISLALWFHAISGLPLATGVTLNYLSSVWMALFMIGGAVLVGQQRSVDGRLVAAVLAGFAGVALVLRPSINGEQLWHGLSGLASGMLAALAYLQVSALGRAGEPEQRVVFYFSAGGVVVGAALALASGGFSTHSLRGALLLLAIGVLASLAQLAMTRAYSIGQTLSNAALQYLGIVFSFGFGVWLFDDPVTWSALAGMALIIGAGLTATWVSARAHTPSAVTPTES